MRVKWATWYTVEHGTISDTKCKDDDDNDKILSPLHDLKSNIS